jgi:3-oxoadipate enol-lactonase/4-carboxymuconolactone decarboxylase
VTPVLRGVVDPTTADAPAAQLLVLGPSLGTTADTWSAVAERLTGRHRVLRWDLPGHGASPAATGAFSVADLARGVLALVDSLGDHRFRYAGVSLGGAVGIELALMVGPDRLDGLAVVCSDARIGAPEAWQERAAQVRRQGTASLVAGSGRRWFAPSFPARDPDTVGKALADLLDVDDESYALACEALADFDRRSDLDALDVPTVVITGDSDPVVSTADGETLAASIPGALALPLADTGHQAQLERPDAIAAAITEHLTAGDDSAASDRYAAGLAVRRSVLGEEYVEASFAGITPETADFQRFITETAWGSVWTRAALDRRMRSAVTIASLVTGGHWHELELHLRAGLTNGLTREELAEILLHTAIYAGVPAANTAFGRLKRVLAEHDDTDET